MQAPPRLQRILLRLQAYDIEIRYKPGKEMVVADALSRLSPVEKHEIHCTRDESPYTPCRIPEVIVCDNGTQFTSSQFRALAQQYGFRIQTSSPYYPRGHGFIERHIQTVKRILTKCRESGDDPNLALLTLRATPLKSNLASPAELLNRRKYKTTLPSVHHPPPDREDVRDILQADQYSQTQYYNRRSTSTPIQELLNNQPIYIQNPINKT
ncbi:uncharacterized protein K02A2.6-like [Asterias rubens]|uniref:uncharacterized protein K02A2.6-like n=1 Tax=Asterias rubens TaxID=7604 RepID=UPI001455A188|nr:uncharacterized protein K02A2.6-like [Asterias rubens]